MNITEYRNDLTFDEVSKNLRYDPETGNMFWKISRKGVRNGKLAGCQHYNADTERNFWQVGLNMKLYSRSRLAVLLMTKEWPPGDVRHRDGNPLNDKWSNLDYESI